MMKEKGFLGRESYKLKFEDLSEAAYGAIIANKIDNPQSEELQKIQLSLLDLFPQYGTFEKLVLEIKEKKGILKDRNTEYVADVLNTLYKTDFNSSESEIDLITFYNDRIKQSLNYLKNGDSMQLVPAILDYHIDETNVLYIFTVDIIPFKFMKAHKENIYSQVTLAESMYSMLQTKIEEILPYISYRKQLEFANQYFQVRQEKTGESFFDFNLKEIQFRHIVTTFEGDNKRVTLPTPLSLGSAERILLPLFMETLGILDVNNFKISSSPLFINDIELIYSVNKPAINNKFKAKYSGLSHEMRKILNETQLEIYERTYKHLNENAAFIGRPNIENNFSELFFWLLKKVTFCLEEPSFLKEKSQLWLNENVKNGYVKMEDNFFLPFLHEKLKNEFGDIVQKKPEKFGGEVDLIFSELPIELKVRKNQKQSLAEIIDEKYKPASQAATYAATTRLAFVCVLDLPTDDKKITNLDHCIKIIEKDFGGGSFKTLILVCTFYCNLPMPSSAN